jgi:hypothetical protein
MALNANALIDTTYFFQMYDDDSLMSDPEQKNKIEDLINAISTAFEKFCNRTLKAKTFTFDTDSDDYDVNYIHYAIFDAPKGNTFWFPTYPVNSVTSFYVSGLEVSAAAFDDYTASNGYIIYGKQGKIFYSRGFDYDYKKNVKVEWNGGYTDDHVEMSDLKYQCFLAMRQYLNMPTNALLESERIGNYSYKIMSADVQQKLRGLAPTVYENLMVYRKVAIG